MKKILFSAMLSALFFCATAQSEKYMNAMKANAAAIDTAFARPSSLLALSNNFERIGAAEKNQWLPYYYAALLQTNYAFRQTDPAGNDVIADRATKLINKADSLMPNNSEISCIKAMIATVHMLVNPMQRYMTDGTTIESNLEAAKAQDPTNPRPYYLKGQNLKGTPAQFGGGCGPASEAFNVAKEKYAAFKPASELAPTWGKEQTDKALAECK